ncbi:MAG: hypothetical protein HZA93_23635 [Verrucomicrobia bacterium]|nr:hypothetical protein [Verrucomicrobiota bacterium]
MKTEIGLVVKSPPVRVPAEFADKVAGLLAEAGDWRTKRELATLLGVAFTPGFERKLRYLAESDERIVSWPGSPGLKHWNFATVPEIDHAINAHESQGADHYRRAMRYRRMFHGRRRIATPAAEQGALL